MQRNAASQMQRMASLRINYLLNTELVLFTNPGSIAQRLMPHRKSILFSRGVRSSATFENVGNVWMQHLVMFEKENRHAMD